MSGEQSSRTQDLMQQSNVPSMVYEALYACPECEERVKNEDASVQCYLCSVWLHIKCANISKGFYKEIKKMAPTLNISVITARRVKTMF